MHSRTLFGILAAALAIAFAPACPADTSTDTESLPLADARQLMNGDQDRLGIFEACAAENYMCALLAAAHLRLRERYQAAAGYLEQALRLGHSKAATTLAFMHTGNERHVEGWAWSYLAYALDDPEQALPEEQTQKLFSVRLLATNHQALDERKLAEAKTRAEELMTEWWPELKPSSDTATTEQPPGSPDLEVKPATRANPEYPRALIGPGIEGFALVYFEVNRRGQVVDAVPVDFSHPAFGDASVDAIKQWRFKVNATDERERYPSSQTIEYYLEDRTQSAGRIGR